MKNKNKLSENEKKELEIILKTDYLKRKKILFIISIITTLALLICWIITSDRNAFSTLLFCLMAYAVGFSKYKYCIFIQKIYLSRKDLDW